MREAVWRAQKRSVRRYAAVPRGSVCVGTRCRVFCVGALARKTERLAQRLTTCPVAEGQPCGGGTAHKALILTGSPWHVPLDVFGSLKAGRRAKRWCAEPLQRPIRRGRASRLGDVSVR
ncbi:hypothetical protein GCM10010191_75010 [Actinomadura vinacea]|uniref:Transposase IS701-like DDE domain-containing protein n=1 Tax=Actinomadura vinacea TaxID=115336 RepID=A0ABP5X6J4_9ACTN